ncbi:phosphatidate cytidylyltransferase, mitochondrial isoform X2 [Morus notabilis]|uniref:phosphatidate cytidylyltransferase, mitochondrial isoform X2 n=1 Tax=Morus notabilis TaxID=981085 RepID=UPI000CED52F2|nr:phosphatidate cytidylyltransferase, mitochondrial isoform X2 [Morus notabilis]
MGSNDSKAEVESLLRVLPPVDFCFLYGSALHPNNHDRSKSIDFILGVSKPLEWHAQNLLLNRGHYVSSIMRLFGPQLITGVANGIGAGVHFNPYVNWGDKMFKYGVVRLHDLIKDILHWERFYLSGRLQKPVHILVDTLDLEDVNSVNLRAAVSAALLLLPTKFSEEDLYAKICSLSYTGDLRMLFAEDKYKVKKIVRGQFDSFQSMYKPFLEEYEGKELLRFSSSSNHEEKIISQDSSLSAARALVSSLPQTIRSQMATKLGGGDVCELAIRSREEGAKCMQNILRRKVMVSSARQAVSGLLAVGAVNGMRYVGRKIRKAWES